MLLALIAGYFQSFNPTYNAVHMSPRWGFDLYGFDISIDISPLWGYVGLLVHWLIELMKPIHYAALCRNLHKGYGIRSMPTTPYPHLVWVEVLVCLLYLSI